MTTAVCPYCRCSIDDPERDQIVCARCGTPHHSDCFSENGGCTLFGCSAAPQDEPKVSVTGADFTETTPDLQTSASAARPAPPPMAGAATAPTTVALNFNAGNVLFRPVPVPVSQVPIAPIKVDPTPAADAKNRTTFILLGSLLGMLGAHNFYAGYRAKAFAQLGITVLTLGYAGLMSWVWAVIDICTVLQDSRGVKFRK